MLNSIKLEELIEGPAAEEIKENNENIVKIKCPVDLRHDRFGNGIYLHKHLKRDPTLKSIHKVSFVDQVQ